MERYDDGNADDSHINREAEIGEKCLRERESQLGWQKGEVQGGGQGGLEGLFTSFICTVVPSVAVCIVEEKRAEEGCYAEYGVSITSAKVVSQQFLSYVLSSFNIQSQT